MLGRGHTCQLHNIPKDVRSDRNSYASPAPKKPDNMVTGTGLTSDPILALMPGKARFARDLDVQKDRGVGL